MKEKEREKGERKREKERKGKGMKREREGKGKGKRKKRKNREARESRPDGRNVSLGAQIPRQSQVTVICHKVPCLHIYCTAVIRRQRCPFYCSPKQSYSVAY